MTEVQHQLVQIIANQLFGADYPLTDTADWHEILDEAQHQTVFPVVFSYLMEYSPNFFNAEGYQIYSKMILAHYASAIRNLQDHNELHKLLKSADIPYTILKGQSSISYYPRPFLRSTGDVDFLVYMADRDKVDDLLREAGYKMTDKTGEHGFHWTYLKDKATIEMHWNLPGMPECNDCIEKYTQSIIEDAHISKNQNGCFFVPSVFHHGLVLLLHSLSHLTSTGMGLRHLLDWLVFENSLEEDVFVDLFEKPLKEIGLWKYAQAMTQIGVHFFSCKKQLWCEDVRKNTCEGILDDIVRSGNFGIKDGTRKLQAKLMRNSVTRKIENRNVLHNLITNVNLRARKVLPAAGRCPILLPIGWCVVGVEYIKWARSRRGEGIGDVVTEAKKRQKLYSELKLFETS